VVFLLFLKKFMLLLYLATLYPRINELED